MARKPSQKRRTKKDNLIKKQQELERLGLKIKEGEWNVSWFGKLAKLGPFLTPVLLAISIIVSGWWYTKQWNLQIEQQRLETERQRQETITNLKREFASENPAIRVAAVLALADYPKEAIPVLTHSLGVTKTTQIEGHPKIEEDTEFIQAIKASLRQIGPEAVTPSVEHLQYIQKELRAILPEYLRGFVYFDPHLFSFDDVFYKPLDFNKLTHRLQQEGNLMLS